MIREWTSRERVQAALEHTEPDRVPIGLPIFFDAYQKLRRYLGFPPEKDIPGCAGEEARLDPEIAAFLGVDLAWVRLRPLSALGAPAGCPETGGAVVYDAWQIGRRLVEREPGRVSLETVVSPLQNARLEDLRDFPWPDPLNPAWTEGLEAEARRLFTGTTLALVGRFGGSILETARDLRGEAQWNRDLAENPDFACALLNRIAALQIALDEAGLRAAGKYLSIFEIREAGGASPGADQALASESLWSGDAWRQTVRPVLERRWQAARLAFSRCDARPKLMISIASPPPAIFQDMMEGGVNVFGTLHPALLGPDFTRLKSDYGERLSFYGGVDAAELLSRGDESDVRRAVRDCLEHLAPGGGFLLAPAQAVQADALPQNIVAMCETVKVYGRYA